ncbi:MAG: PASTA domain-containing protein [Phycisphaerae bacterium]
MRRATRSFWPAVVAVALLVSYLPGDIGLAPVSAIGADNAGDAPPGSRGPASVGNVTYVKNQTYYEEETWVAGGADGSSFLVIQTRRKHKTIATWVFLHGNHLFLRVPGYPPEKITDQPGWGVVSNEGDWGSPFQVDQEELSDSLRKLYKAYDVLHIPFLTGKGWPDDIGATARDAKRTLKLMHLHMITVGAKVDGHVIKQSPPGGTPVVPYTTVLVEFDGKPPTGTGLPRDTADPLQGDTLATAIEVDDRDQGWFAKITNDHHSSVEDPQCGVNGKDVIFRLPKKLGEQRSVTATLARGGYRVTLSAWKEDSPNSGPTVRIGGHKGCMEKRKPRIKYSDDGQDTFIVVDVKDDVLTDHGPISLTLHVEWQVDSSETKPSE